MTAPAPLPRGPFVLLGLMTAATLVGPFVIGFVLRGGSSPLWPPDRPIEWITVLAVLGLVSGLMLACLALGWTNRRGSVAGRSIDDSPLNPLAEVKP